MPFTEPSMGYAPEFTMFMAGPNGSSFEVTLRITPQLNGYGGYDPADQDALFQGFVNLMDGQPDYLVQSAKKASTMEQTCTADSVPEA